MQFGWIATRDAAPDTLAKDLKNAGISPVDTPSREFTSWSFRLLAGLDFGFMNPSALQTAAGTGTGQLIGTQLFGELSFPVSDLWLLGVRLELASTGEAGTNAASKAFSLTSKCTLIELIGEYLVTYDYPWRTSFIIGGGMCMGAAASMTVDGTTTSYSPGSLLGGEALITVSWFMGPSVSLRAEGGYRYLTDGSAAVSAGLSGLVAGAGLALEL
jgi:hypothetical protein